MNRTVKCHSVLLALLLAALPLSADNWMKRLPDNVYVSCLSIPGTHDTATGHGFTSSLYGTFGNKYARTQELSLQEQWDAGIRAFDLRPCVLENYLNINHGIVPTKLHFDVALYALRDLVRDNPSEFAIIHLLHESDGDEVKGVYNERLLELLQRDELRDYFVDFRKDLKVKDMRGKILILSRDTYADTPIGGFLKNWTGSEDWYWETQGTIQGPENASATLYMQDYSDTHNDGGIDIKIAAIEKLLQFSTTHVTNTANDIVWVYNFASAYSKMEKILLIGQEASTSDGYRDNACHTHAAILNFLNNTTKAGPMGIILMDYAGVDWTNDYNTRGKELTEAIIANNFRYLQDVGAVTEADASKSKPVDMTPLIANPFFNANNLTGGWSGDSFGAVNGRENAEHYNCNYDTHQTIEGLPSGVYAVSVKAFYRAGDIAEAYTNYRQKNERSRFARLYAVSGQDTLTLPIVSPYSKKVYVKKNVGREAAYNDGQATYYIPDDMVAAEYYMHDMSSYSNKLFVATDDGRLTLGVIKRQLVDADWTMFDDFALTYYGNQSEAYQYWFTAVKNTTEKFSDVTTSKQYREAHQQALGVTANTKDEIIAAVKAITAAADTLARNAGLWATYLSLGEQASSLLDIKSLPESVTAPLSTYMKSIYKSGTEALDFTNDKLVHEIGILQLLIERVQESITNNIVVNAYSSQGRTVWFTLDGKPLEKPLRQGLYLMRTDDGKVRKILLK